MIIGLMDITDITIYGLRHQLIKLKKHEENKVVFTDEGYTLTLTRSRGRITINGEGTTQSECSYNLDDVNEATVCITNIICTLIEYRYGKTT